MVNTVRYNRSIRSQYGEQNKIYYKEIYTYIYKVDRKQTVTSRHQMLVPFSITQRTLLLNVQHIQRITIGLTYAALPQQAISAVLHTLPVCAATNTTPGSAPADHNPFEK